MSTETNPETMAEIVRLIADRSYIEERRRFVMHFGPRLEGDTVLGYRGVDAYIEWLRQHPDKAPPGILKEQE